MGIIHPQPRYKKGCLAAGCAVVAALLLCGLLLSPVGLFLRQSVIRIEPDEVGLIVSEKEPGGYADRPLLPGIHVVLPTTWVYRLRTNRMVYRTDIPNCNCGSPRSAAFIARDGQAVVIQYHVAFQVDPAGAVELQRKWNGDFIYGAVAPISQRWIEDVGRQYSASEVMAEKSAEVELAVFEHLEAELAQEHLILLEVGFDDARLGEE